MQPPLVIRPRTHDLGNFEVRRALPSTERQMVGAFIFWDQMGPGEFLSGTGLDVRPHPHIGLSTLTYLLEGEILHRDSLGSYQAIRPGDVNLMTAGRGITHSERTDERQRSRVNGLFGIQSWLALPRNEEDGDPSFVHHGADALPILSGEGKKVRVIAGRFLGEASPLALPHPTLYADAWLSAGASLPLDAEFEERAIYTVSGSVEIAGDRFGPSQLLVFRPGDRLTIRAADGPARLMILGGAPMDGPRHIWWNFVHSSRDRIEAAKADWKAGRFGKVPDDDEFIPLPEPVTATAYQPRIGEGSSTT